MSRGWAADTLLDDVLPAIRLLPVDAELHAEAQRRYRASLPSGTSFVDRVSLLLMEREGIQMALATDPDLIREGIDAMTAGHRVEEPRLPLFSSGIDDLASPTDELLEGFGER